MKYRILADKIIALKNADLKMRNQLVESGQLGNAYNQKMQKLHNSNAEQLNKIIDKIGYPTLDKVGEAANEATWLIIQHAIGQPVFMKKCAQLLENAVIENKASAKNLAYLKDRIAVFEGRPQNYGTQFDWDENGALSPQAYDDLSKVNERRKSIGLNTLEEQTAIMRKRVVLEKESPPTDFAERKTEMEKWKKKVGWQS